MDLKIVDVDIMCCHKRYIFPSTIRHRTLASEKTLNHQLLAPTTAQWHKNRTFSSPSDFSVLLLYYKGEISSVGQRSIFFFSFFPTCFITKIFFKHISFAWSHFDHPRKIIRSSLYVPLSAKEISNQGLNLLP